MKKPVKIIIFVVLALLVLIGGYYLFSSSSVIESLITEATFSRSIDTETAQPQDESDIFRSNEDVYLSFKTYNWRLSFLSSVYIRGFYNIDLYISANLFP